jgi:chemotaxis protein methyltransferase CheR
LNVTERSDVDRFRDVVARRFGLRFDDARLGQLAEVLDRRLAATREPPGLYLNRIASGALTPDDLQALAAELTVSETYLFRNIEQFRALAELALPARIATRATSRTLRVLSAGCASGDEAYTVAILIREQPGLEGWDISIEGVDLSMAAIEKATRAQYSTWSLRETPADIRERFFRPLGRDFVLDPQVRGMVQFRRQNLLDDEAFWQPDAFDVVFCRNVLMYLTPEATRQVVERIARSLAPGGFLFLGHAETLRGLSRAFQLQHTHGTFYYRRREGAAGAACDEAVLPVVAAERVRREPVPPTGSDTSWVESIQAASQRVEALVRAASAAHGPGHGSAPSGSGPKPERLRAEDLLRAERYGEAQASLGSLSGASARDADVLLLKAVLLTHGGDLENAEAVCRDLIERDEMSAGAHYVTALCREGAGALNEAVEHDQLAVYLDPEFGMPRLHLGLLARRAGDKATARRELERALVLLENEEPARLLLFGGGFSRGALLALCRSELERCASPR